MLIRLLYAAILLSPLLAATSTGDLSCDMPPTTFLRQKFVDIVTRSVIYRRTFGAVEIESAGRKDRLGRIASGISEAMGWESSASDLAPARQDRLFGFYVPVALWLEQQHLAGKTSGSGSGGAVCVGMSLPQGGGKTTLADAMVAGMGAVGISTGVVSIDDFYLTHHEQEKLARPVTL